MESTFQTFTETYIPSLYNNINNGFIILLFFAIQMLQFTSIKIVQKYKQIIWCDNLKEFALSFSNNLKEQSRNIALPTNISFLSFLGLVCLFSLGSWWGELSLSPFNCTELNPLPSEKMLKAIKECITKTLQFTCIIEISKVYWKHFQISKKLQRIVEINSHLQNLIPFSKLENISDS